MKTYRLDPSSIAAVAVGFGSCIASDRITVDGARVGYCYRDEPDDDLDSGWRFFAGSETQEYADDAGNFAIYDVNTIANYDGTIVSILESPIGSAFERSASGDLVAVSGDEV